MENKNISIPTIKIPTVSTTVKSPTIKPIPRPKLTKDTMGSSMNKLENTDVPSFRTSSPLEKISYLYYWKPDMFRKL